MNPILKRAPCESASKTDGRPARRLFAPQMSEAATSMGMARDASGRVMNLMAATGARRAHGSRGVGGPNRRED
jgi:hypothetical protein